MTEIAGSRVLVTGGASGLGRLLAVGMARLGATPVLWDIDGPALEEVTAEIADDTRRPAHGFTCDVSDRHAVYAVADRVRDEVGEIDIVVNNAGIVSGAPLLELDDESIERTFQVNTLALYWVTRAFLPGMVARDHGHVVTVASAAGFVATARQTDYAASKWAAIGFDESLRAELRQAAPGVRTTVVCPSYIDTGMFEGATSRYPRLLPFLEAREVVSRIVDAVLRDKRRVVMPATVYAALLARPLPPAVFDAAVDLLGLNEAMDAFVGRARREDVDPASS